MATLPRVPGPTVSPGVIVRVRDPQDAEAALVEMRKAMRAGRWDLVGQWAGVLQRYGRRMAKDLPPPA